MRGHELLHAARRHWDARLSLTDYECWWTGHATWVSDCASTCAIAPTNLYLGTEPALQDPHPPACRLKSSLSTALIVDDLSDGPPLNVVGCSQTPNWHNDGTFTYSPGTNAATEPTGLIDTHQLGAGFGGHFLFTHVENPADSAVVNVCTWAPKLPKIQYYDIQVYVPDTGADAKNAIYTITPMPGALPQKVRVDQTQGGKWVDLGGFGLGPGATVRLTNGISNQTTEYGKTDVAFDAMAFLPEGGTPQIISASPDKCAPYLFVGARGSGEDGNGTPGWTATSDNQLGLAARVGPVEQRLARHLGAGNLTALSVNYRADDVYKLIDVEPVYIDHLEAGVQDVITRLRELQQVCPDQKILMSGYSSGAMVVHRSILGLAKGNAKDQRIANRIAGAVFIADGDRHPADPVRDYGSASDKSHGVGWAFRPLSRTRGASIPDRIAQRTLSVCDWRDIVCDFRNLNKINVAYGVAVHSFHYKSDRARDHFAWWLWHHL